MKIRKILEIDFKECGIVFFDKDRIKTIIEAFSDAKENEDCFMDIEDCKGKTISISQWSNKAFRVHSQDLVYIDNFNKKEFLEVLQKEINELT